jgi:hypothetical protein
MELMNLITFGIIPQFVPTFWTTIEVCIAVGGLFLAAVAMKKKKMALKLAESDEKEDMNKKNASLAEKYRNEHPEVYGNMQDQKEDKTEV